MEEEFLDIDFILDRDKVIKCLLDYDRFYSLSDTKKIKNLVRTLLKYLERGNSMEKDDNKLKIDIYCLIAQKDNNIFKTYYVTYDRFIKELKYYILLDYQCQVERIKRELVL